MAQIYTYKTLTELRDFARQRKVRYAPRLDEPALLEALSSLGFTDACAKQDYTDHYGTEPPPFNFTEWKKEQKELKESVGEEVEEELEETVTEEAEAEETVTEDPVAEEAVTEEAVTEELEDEEPEFYVAEQPRKQNLGS